MQEAAHKPPKGAKPFGTRPRHVVPKRFLPHWIPKTAKARALRRQRLLAQRNYYATSSSITSNAIKATTLYLLPWEIRTYPGRCRGLWTALQQRISLKSARAFYSGAPRSGRWIYRRLIELVNERIAAGERVRDMLVRELEARGPEKLRGLQIRDPDTGLPKYRYRGGRKKEQPAEERKGETRI